METAMIFIYTTLAVVAFTAIVFLQIGKKMHWIT